MKSTNRLNDVTGNTLKTAHKARNFVIDATKTYIHGILDPIKGLGETTTKIGKAIYKSATKGRLEEKLRKIPASIAASPLMAIEGIAETLFQSSYNLSKNIGTTITNPFKESRISIKGAFDNENKKPKMRLANLF